MNTPQNPSPKPRLGKPYIILYLLTALSAILYAIAVRYEAFADFFNQYISSAVRAILAYTTNWLPFSFAEGLLLSLPLLLVLILLVAFKKYSASWRHVLIYCAKILSIVALLIVLFIWSFGIAYHGSTLDQKLDIDRREVSVEDLEKTTRILADKVNEELDNICFRYENFSVMPYSYAEMNDRLLAAYDRVCDSYPFVQRLYSRVKPVMLSEPMSYTHITGVYSYFTGEANINVNFPDYTIPYTAAHELAHQRGIAREDEANFIAFLVCIASDDPYIRYSGYLNLYEYVATSLYSVDEDAYFEILATLKMPVRYEMRAYSVFYDQYRHSTVGEISSAVNDTYLKAQGTVGTKSYGMVVDLAVAYYKNPAAE